jgi:DNA-binding Lrp family transcriptional regulator
MADVAERIFTPLEQRLLNEFQRDFPTTPRPYAEIAVRLGTDENTVIETCTRLLQENAISRIGVTVAPRRAGASTLAAMSVPDNRLGEVANIVSGYREVNHNYERDHEMNLWFVVTAPSAERIPEVLSDIGNRTGIDVLEFPLEEAYRLDLGFDLKWT